MKKTMFFRILLKTGPFSGSRPLRGAKTPLGFHPCFRPVPNSGRNSSGMAGVPLRGAKTRRVFIPAFVLSPIRFNPIPNSGRNSSGMAGRAPP
ncbi:MAG: hypothetical protein LBK61_07520, partial [Spirochaetaceae bacterium]|nr:hypothetical protein [Spirochaetaceae bacterium]